jgi:hypothetical protein
MKMADLRGHNLAPQTLEYKIKRNTPKHRTQICNKSEETPYKMTYLGVSVLPKRPSLEIASTCNLSFI